MTTNWRSYSRYFPTSSPRRVEGGIKAQSTHGAFGQRWWAKRWIAMLERFDIGQRLNRGRSYARGGQVISINISAGVVRARVQGSRSNPYVVALTMRMLSDDDWKNVLAALSTQAIFVAKLLAGEMPDEIEDVFEGVELSLFPMKRNDMQMECSCPDWSTPCKHIAAVFYLLGEEFDRDPFLIFKLRGMDRDTLVSKLSPEREAGSAPAQPVVMAPQIDPLPVEALAYWCGQRLPEKFFGEVHIPSSYATLLRRLGAFPFWRGEELPLEALPPIYPQASKKGLQIFLTEREEAGKR